MREWKTVQRASYRELIAQALICILSCLIATTGTIMVGNGNYAHDGVMAVLGIFMVFVSLPVFIWQVWTFGEA